MSRPEPVEFAAEIPVFVPQAIAISANVLDMEGDRCRVPVGRARSTGEASLGSQLLGRKRIGRLGPGNAHVGDSVHLDRRQFLRLIHPTAFGLASERKYSRIEAVGMSVPFGMSPPYSQ